MSSTTEQTVKDTMSLKEQKELAMENLIKFADTKKPAKKGKFFMNLLYKEKSHQDYLIKYGLREQEILSLQHDIEIRCFDCLKKYFSNLLFLIRPLNNIENREHLKKLDETRKHHHNCTTCKKELNQCFTLNTEHVKAYYKLYKITETSPLTEYYDIMEQFDFVDPLQYALMFDILDREYIYENERQRLHDLICDNVCTFTKKKWKIYKESMFSNLIKLCNQYVITFSNNQSKTQSVYDLMFYVLGDDKIGKKVFKFDEYEYDYYGNLFDKLFEWLFEQSPLAVMNIIASRFSHDCMIDLFKDLRQNKLSDIKWYLRRYFENYRPPQQALDFILSLKL